MALSTLTSSCVTVVSSFFFGGSGNKKRKMATFTLNDPAATSGGMVIGGAAGDIPASAFGFSKIDSCSSIQIYTTSTGATVKVVAASPNLAGTSILTVLTAADTITDITIATTESAQITVVGY